MTLEEFLNRACPEPNTGCYLWTGYCLPGGYGQVKFGGRTALAHRAVWELVHGPTVLDVLHKCDTPACINPEHLFEGTHLANMRDKVRKARHVTSPGELNGSAKLTTGDVWEIRNSNESHVTLAKRYGVTLQNIRLIVSRQKWQHV